MLRAAVLRLALGHMLLAPGLALAQSPSRCTHSGELLMIAADALDLTAFREACGTATPELWAAAHHIVEAVLGHAARISGPQAEARMRTELARVLPARERAYRDPVRGNMQAACAADRFAVMPAAELTTQFREAIQELAELTAPGGPLSRPECPAD